MRSGSVIGETHLRDSNELAIGAPSCLLKILWDLCGFPRSSLANDDGHGECLDEIEEGLFMACNRQ